MRETWNFFSAGQVVFGAHAVRELGNVSRRLGLRRLLVATDPVLEKAGLVDQVTGPLQEAGVTVEIFNGGEPEPSFRAAEACVAQARAFQPDGLVGLGGGSNMDLAKIAATVLAHGGTPGDYVGDDQIPGPVRPVICVPTTADSGIDALTHAVEAYTAVDNAQFPLEPGQRTIYQGRHPLADCLAEKAIALIGAHLRQAVRDGSNLEAREAMALGAMLAGLAFSNVGVALAHAMEYPVGGAVHCAHGTGNGLLLPHVMRFNLPVRKRELARIAALLGENVSGLSEESAAERAVAAVDRLRADIGVPGRLRDVGVQESMLPAFAEKASGIRRILRVNPRTVTKEEVLNLYRAAY